MTDDRIYELAKQHLGGKGHDLIWQDDPRYAAACDMPKDARWSKTNVAAEETLAFARALLAEAAASVPACRRCGGAMKPGKAIPEAFAAGNEGTISEATHAGGAAPMVDCMKCEACGWSVTPGVPGTDTKGGE